jgi:hypothetical protein
MLAEYLGIQIEYTPQAVVRLVKIYKCFAYDWTQSEMNERLHDMTPKQENDEYKDEKHLI